MRNIGFLLILVLSAAVVSQAAVITPYTNRGEWNAALAAMPGIQMYTETFDDGLVNQTGLSVVSGWPGSVQAFQWADRVEPAVDVTTWSISLPENAPVGFGGTFDLTPGGEGTGLDVYAYIGGTWEFAFSVPSNAASAFYGFISDTGYTQVQFRAGTEEGVAETYNLDDLSYANTVPEPATFVLLGAGLIGIGLLRRRRG